MEAKYAIIARDKDFGKIGRALIRGSKEYCEKYLAEDNQATRAYKSQPARFDISVEEITDKPWAQLR